MENTEKRVPEFEIKKLKETIKVASEYQRFLKNQRKTEKLVGKREMSHSEATWKHLSNRTKLSAMFVAYGVMRGKDMDEQIKAHVSKKDEWAIGNAKAQVENLLSEYRIKEIEAVEE